MNMARHKRKDKHTWLMGEGENDVKSDVVMVRWMLSAWITAKQDSSVQVCMQVLNDA